MKHLLFILLALCAIGFTACEAVTQDHEEESIDMEALRAEIQAMEDAYAVAQNAGDADAVVVYYAEDAVSMGPDEPPAVGKAAILASIKDQFASDTTESTTRFEVVDLWAQGTLAVEVGRSVTTDADGNETTGKYISVFENRDGKWICVRDIYNDDAPDDAGGDE